ncbi:MAG: alpha/beta fold hydrolase [Pseudomonadota bacterium]
MEQTIRYVRTASGIRLACATSGDGPPIVKAANWLNHLEYDWESPVWRHWLHLFSAERTLVRYDERGCGLSQRDIDGLSFEDCIEDLETVVDALELERFPLIGISQGGAFAVEYAARHPQRVSHLILAGAFAQGRQRRDQAAKSQQRAMMELIRYGWAQDTPAFRQAFASIYLPDGSGEQLHWFAELQRRSATPEMAVSVMEMTGTIDVADRLASLEVPTLVVHANEDAAVPQTQGVLLASEIPGAQYLPLESRNHLLLESEAAWPRFCDVVSGFLGLQGATKSAGTTVRSQTYYVGDYQIDTARREVRRQGELIGLEPKAYQLLTYLIEHRDRAVGKDELQDVLWPKSIVTESSLSRVIMKARRAIGDDDAQDPMIRTVRGHGYRFVAPVG